MLTPEDIKRDELLVADDEAEAAECLSLLVESKFPQFAGKIHTAQSGPEALAALDALREKIRFVLTDKDMPPPDGMQIAQEAVKRGLHAALITGRAEEVPADVPYPVVAKPIDPATFTPFLSRLFRPRILHVDDEPSVLTAIERLARLERGNKEWVSTHHESDARNIIEAVHAQLCMVVSDWNIQSRGGGADIVARAVAHNVPTVVVIADHDPDDIRKTLAKKGVPAPENVAIFGKPFRFDELGQFFREATMLQLKRA